VYLLSADDIGAVISVEVSPRELDGAETGVAVGSFGPVAMSPQLRCALAEVAKEGKWEVTGKGADTGEKATVLVNSEKVELRLGEEGKLTSLPLSCTFPSLTIDEMHPKSLLLSLSPSEFLILLLPSHHERELLVLSIRYFQQLLYSLTPLQAQPSLLRTSLSEAGYQFLAHFDIGLELAQIRRELFLSIEANEQLQREKMALRRQIGEMEREMGETLQSFKSMMADTDRAEERERMQEELQGVRGENERLGEVVQKLERRVGLLQETNNSYKGRIVDLQAQLEDFLVAKETEDTSHSYRMEAIELVPNSPRCSKVLSSASVTSGRKSDSVRVHKLESELNKLKTEHRCTINLLKDRYEARCSALRRVVELQVSSRQQRQVGEGAPASPVLLEKGSFSRERKQASPSTDLANPASDFDPFPPVAESDANQSTSTPSPAEKSLPTAPLPPSTEPSPALPDPLQSLQARISSLEQDKASLQLQLQAESTEREKYQRESDLLSAKLSRAEAQVRKVQRQLSVNTG